MTLYGKDEADDLTHADKSVLRNAIAAELKARALETTRKQRTPGR